MTKSKLPYDRLTFEGNFCEIAKCREERWGKYCPDGACSQRKVWERLKEYEDALSAGVAPVVHGRWIDNGACGYKWAFSCSKCGYIDGYPFNDRHNYCPNCGAKMDGAE